MLAKLGALIGKVSDRPLFTCVATLVGGLVFSVLEYSVMSGLARSGLTPERQTLVDAATIGSGAAVVLWVLLLGVRARRRRVAEDLARIAELNHEIRNALQVITHVQYLTASREREMVLTSVSRIDAVLKRLFPIGGLFQPPAARKRESPSPPEEGPVKRRGVSP